MSKKSKKGKTTMPLTDFLSSEPKLVTVRESSWSAIVDEDDEKKKLIVVDMSGLPTAPRAAVDIDYSNIPNNPPFVAHVANLSFEIDDEGLRRIFADLNPKSARLLRDGTRSRGIGLVEFESRDTLIEGLKRTDKEIYGRKIRVALSDKTETDSGRGGFSHRSNRSGGGGGEERPEMGDTWKRVERKFDNSSDDRQGTGFNRDRPNRNDPGRSNFSGSSRDGQRGSDYGFGYPRTRDDRTGGGNRDNDRQGPRRRYNDDDNRQNSGMDRPRYGDRYNDTRDTRDENPSNDDNREAPKERPRLHLQPRTKPVEELQPLAGSSSSVNNVAASLSISNNTEDSPSMNDYSNNHPDEYQQQESHDTSDAGSSVEQSTVKPLTPSRGAGASIFGGAKPVDTAAKELEIERKLKELQIANSETGGDHEEREASSRPSYNRGSERDNYRVKRSSHNDDYHNRDRDRRDDGRSGHGGDYHHRREHSGGRRYEDDNRRHNDDNHYRRDRDNYNGSSRRDNDTGRSGKYNHHGHSDRDNYRHSDRETNESNSHRRPSNSSSNAESQTKNQQRTILRRTTPAEDDSNKLQLSNKFGMLIDDDDAQSPTIDD